MLNGPLAIKDCTTNATIHAIAERDNLYMYASGATYALESFYLKNQTPWNRERHERSASHFKVSYQAVLTQKREDEHPSLQ